MPLEGDETLLKSITVEGEGHWDSKRLDKGQVFLVKEEIYCLWSPPPVKIGFIGYLVAILIFILTVCFWWTSIASGKWGSEEVGALIFFTLTTIIAITVVVYFTFYYPQKPRTCVHEQKAIRYRDGVTFYPDDPVTIKVVNGEEKIVAYGWRFRLRSILLNRNPWLIFSLQIFTIFFSIFATKQNYNLFITASDARGTGYSDSIYVFIFGSLATSFIFLLYNFFLNLEYKITRDHICVGFPLPTIVIEEKTGTNFIVPFLSKIFAIINFFIVGNILLFLMWWILNVNLVTYN
jgi:hypothetical protein